MSLRHPLHILFLLGFLVMAVDGAATLLGWADTPWPEIAGSSAVLLAAGVEALLRRREGRPVWDVEGDEG